MSRFILPAALAACALLSSYTVSADDRHGRNWGSDHSRYSDNDRHDRRWDDRRGHDRNWRGNDRNRGRWSAPPARRHYYYYPPPRYGAYSRGYRPGWYGGRYYAYPQRYHYPDRDIHGRLIITVPIW